MTATVLPFPGVDLTTITHASDPRGKTLVVQKRGGLFYLKIKRAGWVYTRFSTAAQARSYAGNLCQSYPRIYQHVIDETRSTRRSLGETMAGTPRGGGTAA